MALVECRIGPPSRHSQVSIITLAGEHDIATIGVDNEALTAAIASCEGDVVLDVSGVTFMSAATVDLIIRARQVLERQSRSLTLQSPSRSAKRVLDLCGVSLSDQRSVEVDAS